MPGMDGFETARLIRQRDASRHIPIIFLTATGADIGNIYEAYSVGAVDYLTKPIDPNVVRAKVGVFVDLHLKGRRILRQEVQLREAEQRRSAEALRQSEALYATTFHEAAVGIGHCGSDGRWLRVNRKLCEIFGRSEEDLLGLQLQDLTYPRGFEQSAAVRRLLAGTLDTHRQELPCVLPDGREAWVNLTLSVIRNSVGAPSQLIAVIEDVSERRREEERQHFLASASARLLSSFDDEKNLAGVAEVASRSFADWCFVDRAGQQQPSQPIVGHRDEAKAEQWRAWRRRVPEIWDTIVSRVMVARAPQILHGGADGRNADGIWEAESKEALRSLGINSLVMAPLVAHQAVLGTLALGVESPRDFVRMDLRMAEELARRAAFALDNARLYREAQDAIRARDDFLSIASHELRTPLTPLQLQLQGLVRRLEGDSVETIPADRLRGALTRSEKQVRRLARLIDALLDVSRISAGKLELAPEEFDLVDLVNEILGRLSAEIPRQEGRGSVVSAGPVVGHWDRLRIEQVISNLIGNAIKYGGDQSFTIELRRTDRAAQIQVSDNGIGIPTDKLERIFDRYERAVSSRSYGGLGLGLYIAKQIVDAHGGSISVRSELGVGSAFTVELPLRRVQLAPDLGSGLFNPSARPGDDELRAADAMAS
jgi:PAS domain S-box-containing protein